MNYVVESWHASLQRDEPALADPATGEVRVPIELLRLDDHAGEIDLVLARREVEQLHSALGRLLAGELTAVCAIR